MQPGAEPRTKNAPLPHQPEGTDSGGGGSAPPPLKLFSASRSDVFQHGPHPSSLIWKPQVSERPSHPPKKSPQTRRKGPETLWRGLCPG